MIKSYSDMLKEISSGTTKDLEDIYDSRYCSTAEDIMSSDICPLSSKNVHLMWFLNWWHKRKRCAEKATSSGKKYLDNARLIVVANEDCDEQRAPKRGSVPGRQTIQRDRFAGNRKLMADYFDQDSVYDDHTFRRRYRMTKSMFLAVANRLELENPYFQFRMNAASTWGFTPIQKVTVALRMLAYGVSADSYDEVFQMGESTVLQTVREFIRSVVHIYGDQYLRLPNNQDIARLLAKAQQRGFPGMIGSIDCMHWEWEKCPTAWHGMYRGHFKKPTLILEAVASYDLWIWHAFFGLPGSLNDINVLHRSPVFENLAKGSGPSIKFTVNGKEYDMGYYLADGIYPSWATLISGIPAPYSNKDKLFTRKQAEYRKDIERAFGVLQGKFGIIKGPARLWDPMDLKYIVDCIVILHNMSIDYERDMDQLRAEDYEHSSTALYNTDKDVPKIQTLMEMHRKIQSREGHNSLLHDLVDHVWNHYGGPQEHANWNY